MGHSSSIKKAVRSITVMGLILGDVSLVYAQGGQAGGTLFGQSGASKGQGRSYPGRAVLPVAARGDSGWSSRRAGNAF